MLEQNISTCLQHAGTNPCSISPFKLSNTPIWQSICVHLKQLQHSSFLHLVFAIHKLFVVFYMACDSLRNKNEILRIDICHKFDISSAPSISVYVSGDITENSYASRELTAFFVSDFLYLKERWKCLAFLLLRK